jgi:hypothetical protein
MPRLAKNRRVHPGNRYRSKSRTPVLEFQCDTGIVKRERAMLLMEQILRALDEGKTEQPLKLVTGLYVFGSFARGALEPHDVDLDIEFEPDRQWGAHFAQCLAYGRDPHGPMKRALAGGKRGCQLQFNFRDPTGRREFWPRLPFPSRSVAGPGWESVSPSLPPRGLDDLNAAKAAADLCGRAHLASVNNSYTWLVLRVRGCSRLGTIAQGRPPKAAPP